jgi:hypothetical protein
MVHIHGTKIIPIFQTHLGHFFLEEVCTAQVLLQGYSFLVVAKVMVVAVTPSVQHLLSSK